MSLFPREIDLQRDQPKKSSNTYTYKSKILLRSISGIVACWEVIRAMAVNIKYAWVAWFQDSATSADGFHGLLLIVKNARYILINLSLCRTDYHNGNILHIKFTQFCNLIRSVLLRREHIQTKGATFLIRT